MADSSAPYCTVELRPRGEFGATDASGLTATHHFCFAAYQRPDRIDWGDLRAFHEYRLEPGAVRNPAFNSGFEILTLVEEGWLRRLGTHQTRRVIHAGSAELISCGPGVDIGAEAAGGEPVSFVEIWIRSGGSLDRSRRQWRPAMPEGLDRPIAAGAHYSGPCLRLGCNAEIARISLSAGERVERRLETGHRDYLAMRAGALAANDIEVVAGDGLAASEPGFLSLRALTDTELIWIRTSELAP